MTKKRFCAFALLLGYVVAALGVLCLVMFSGCGPMPAPAPAPPPISRPPIVKPPLPPPAPAPAPLISVAQQLLIAHNQQRANAGLAPLTINPKLQLAAQQHSDYQAKVKQMAHEGIGDGTPFTRMQADGYQFSSAGENIAWNQQTVAAVMTAWMNSAGHKANILGPYKEVGLAVAYNPGPYWTVDFGTSMNRSLGEIQILTTTAPVVTRAANSAASSTTTTTPGVR